MSLNGAGNQPALISLTSCQFPSGEISTFFSSNHGFLLRGVCPYTHIIPQLFFCFFSFLPHPSPCICATSVNSSFPQEKLGHLATWHQDLLTANKLTTKLLVSHPSRKKYFTRPLKQDQTPTKAFSHSPSGLDWQDGRTTHRSKHHRAVQIDYAANNECRYQHLQNRSKCDAVRI
ncbi:hypothetical protein DL98DRAFT_520876 [Cadophora sp. DSE1049]|nr:hypothetical protein DL98DRAFT_520876 [Cadophora sp. DSE1049]